jgi:hypothetical protein
MDSRNILEKLQAANPQAEIWWDSAPMVYGKLEGESCTFSSNIVFILPDLMYGK